MTDQKSIQFKKIYAENIAIVSHVIRMFPALKNDSEDIAHDVFMNFFQKMGSIAIQNEKAYLVTSARNTCLTRLEKRRTQRTDLQDSEATTQKRLWESDANHEFNIGLISELIDELATEPPGGPDFAMFYREGLSMKEITERTGDPIGTVAARISRMRDKMRRLIQERMVDFQ